MSKDLSNIPPKEMTRSEQEQRIAELKAETVIPLLEAARDTIQQWAKDGTLHQEMHGKKLGSLINDMAKLIAAASPKGPVVAVLPAPAPGDSKDPTYYRANSAMNKTPEQRERERRIVDAEVVEEP